MDWGRRASSGLPLLGFTFIDFFIFSVYKNRAETEVAIRLGSNPNHEEADFPRLRLTACIARHP